MPGPSPTSREHRLRVLTNQAKLAAEGAPSQPLPANGQLTIPLIVEVKATATPTRAPRSRRRAKPDQRDLGDL